MPTKSPTAWLAGLDEQEARSFAASHPQAALSRALRAWDLPQARQGAALLAGLALKDANSPLALRPSTADAIARLLSTADEAAERFARLAKEVVWAKREDLIARFDGPRLLWLEGVLEGVVSTSSPSLWGKAPEWCAAMRASGRLDARQILACVQAACRERDEANQLKKGDPLQARASQFALKAEAADSGWGAAVWDAFFSLDALPQADEDREEEDNEEDVEPEADGNDENLAWRCMDYASFETGANPFESLRNPLTPKTAKLLELASWSIEGNESVALDLGCFLARVPEWALPRRLRGQGPARLMVDLACRPVGRLVARNASAQALCAIAHSEDGRTRHSPFCEDDASLQARAWLALARGLAEGGAPAPRFELQWAIHQEHGRKVASWEGAGEGAAFTLLALSDVLPGGDRDPLLRWIAGEDLTGLEAALSRLEGEAEDEGERRKLAALRSDAESLALRQTSRPARPKSGARL